MLAPKHVYPNVMHVYRPNIFVDILQVYLNFLAAIILIASIPGPAGSYFDPVVLVKLH